MTNLDMEKIKNFFRNNSTTIDIFIIITIMLIFSVLFSNHIGILFSDRGRELFLPQEVLYGNVPYKDITLIYFPMAYYLNALIYKVLGISINSLIISQTIICTIFAVIYYSIARYFMSQRTSLLFTIFIISSCVFAEYDLFSLIFPYSFARAYGIIGIFVMLFSFLKLYKTDNIKYAYWGAIATGFVLCCKFEFCVSIIIYLSGLILYKKLHIVQYLKVFLSLLVFPIIILSILFFNGVTIQNLTDSIKFAMDFSSTQVMTDFLTFIGLFPGDLKERIPFIIYNSRLILIILGIAFIGFISSKKFNNPIFMILMAVLIWYLHYKNSDDFGFLWVGLSYSLLLISCIFFKKLLYKDNALILLCIVAFILSSREFFQVSFYTYGTFSFFGLGLYLFAIIYKFSNRNINVAHFLNYLLIILIGLYSYDLFRKNQEISTVIETTKGTLNLEFPKKNILQQTIDYVNNNIKENETILALPEGNIINFFTDRKVNLHCFMMDRLYYDAYGDKKATEMVVQTNSDYIFILSKLDVWDFYRPFLYEKNTNSLIKYIDQNYIKIHTIGEEDTGMIEIYKKKL